MRRYLSELEAPFYFAGVGDIHGRFEDLALVIEELAEQGWPRPAFCLAAGDVEAIRSEEELDGVHAPAKYRKPGDFVRVMRGEIELPPLFFTGGNHEPWPALDAAGAGWWGTNTVFLGRSGITEIGGLVVANLSGIYSEKVSPGRSRDRDTVKRKTYYTLEEVAWLEKHGRNQRIDVLLTHDWPAGVGVSRHGDPAGDDRIAGLVERLRPQYAICGHMHHRQRRELGKTVVESLGHMRGWRQAVELFYFDGRKLEALGTSSEATEAPPARG